MEVDVLKSSLAKLKKFELFSLLERWKFLGNSDLVALKSDHEENRNKQQTKKSLDNRIADFCSEKGGLTMEISGELDLISTYKYSRKKKWSVYRLSYEKGEELSPRSVTDPNLFKKKFQQQLGLYFNTMSCVSVCVYDGAFWVRVYIHTGNDRKYKASNTMYMVYYPRTPIVIVTGMKASFHDFLSQCLLTTLGYSKLNEISLTGHHVDSLAELALNRYSQGGFIKFQLNEAQNGALPDIRPRKRKEPFQWQDERISCENEKFKKQRTEALDDTFGPNEQPTLEKLEYKVQVRFRGTDVVPEMASLEEPFHCRVKFEGTSVLEGIRNLGKTGLATVPLPKHLTSITSLAKNHFVLADQTRLQNKNQSHRVTEGDNVKDKNDNVRVSDTIGNQSKPHGEIQTGERTESQSKGSVSNEENQPRQTSAAVENGSGEGPRGPLSRVNIQKENKSGAQKNSKKTRNTAETPRPYRQITRSASKKGQK